MLRRSVLALVASTVLLAACGDDGGDDARAEYVDAMTASMAADEALPVPAESRECLAGEFVDALGGASVLEDAGVTPAALADGEDLTALDLGIGEGEAQAMAASFGNCDVSLAEMVLGGAEVPADVRTCVEENLDEELLADFFVQVLVEEAASDQPPEALLEPLTACF